MSGVFSARNALPFCCGGLHHRVTEYACPREKKEYAEVLPTRRLISCLRTTLEGRDSMQYWPQSGRPRDVMLSRQFSPGATPARASSLSQFFTCLFFFHRHVDRSTWSRSLGGGVFVISSVLQEVHFLLAPLCVFLHCEGGWSLGWMTAKDTLARLHCFIVLRVVCIFMGKSEE